MYNTEICQEIYTYIRVCHYYKFCQRGCSLNANSKVYYRPKFWVTSSVRKKKNRKLIFAQRENKVDRIDLYSRYIDVSTREILDAYYISISSYGMLNTQCGAMCGDIFLSAEKEKRHYLFVIVFIDT